MKISQKRLRELVSYDQDTGIFTWKASRGNQTNPGDGAGYTRHDGYLILVLDRRIYLGHRVAWFYVHDEWPHEIDHINGDPADIRITNLRPVTRSQNMMNMKLLSRNTSGYKGVSWDRRSAKWQSYITIDNRKISLGYYQQIGDAAAARRAGEAKYFGEYARDGE